MLSKEDTVMPALLHGKGTGMWVRRILLASHSCSWIQAVIRRRLRSFLGWYPVLSATRFEPFKLEALADIVALRYPRLDDLNIIGFVDGCKVAIKTPSSVVDATATYNGWVHCHFRSNVLAFDAWGPLHYPTWVGLVVVGVAFHFSSKQAAALDEVFWGIRTTFT